MTTTKLMAVLLLGLLSASSAGLLAASSPTPVVKRSRNGLWPNHPSFFSREGDSSVGARLANGPDGRIVAAGTLWQGDPRWGVGVVCYQSNGKELWSYVWDSDGTLPVWDDELRAFAVDASGNVYVAIAYFAPLASRVVIKLTADGQLEWVQKDDGFCTGLALDSQGHCLVCGTVDSGVNPRSFLAKYSPAGQLEWERRFGVDEPPYWGDAADLAIDSTDHAIVVGFEFSIDKFDSNGLPTWSRNYHGQSAYRVAIGPGDDIYVTGTALNPNGFLVRLDADGQERWQSTFSLFETNWTNPLGLLVSPSGNVFVQAAGNYSSGIAAVTASGEARWILQEPTPLDFDLSSRFALDPSGDLWLVSQRTTDLSQNLTLSRLAPDGLVRWQENLSFPGFILGAPGDIIMGARGKPVISIVAQGSIVAGWLTTEIVPNGRMTNRERHPQTSETRSSRPKPFIRR